VDSFRLLPSWPSKRLKRLQYVNAVIVVESFSLHDKEDGTTKQWENLYVFTHALVNDSNLCSETYATTKGSYGKREA